jgi:hypothetical protein
MPAIRISYHSKDRLPLITGPVRQAFDALKASDPDLPLFFRSGWLQGPHLDLCLVGDSPVDLAPPLATIRSWLDAHPSTAVLDPGEYARTSRQLGALEGIKGPFLPLRPDNRVTVEDYRPPRLVDGHEVLQRSYRGFFSASAPALFEVAALKARDPAAATLVLTAMLALAADQLEPEGLARGYISLQAHADFFFANYDSSGRIRAHFERMEESWRSPIDLAVKGRPDLAVGGDLAPNVARIMSGWSEVLAWTKADIQRVIAEDDSWFYYNPGAFPDAPDPEHMEAFAAAGLGSREIGRGATLERIAGGVDVEFFQSPEFQTCRIILNMYYSLLPGISVSPAERFGMCFLVAESVKRNGDRQQRPAAWA